MHGEYIIEIATSDYTSTRQAVLGGADRIELCTNLGEGGTTPSYGLIKKCLEDFDVPVYPIIRIRGGDFLYTPEEMACMLEDVRACSQLGCKGVVFGALNRDATIDTEALKRIVDAAYPMKVTFHRAFDRCRDPLEALEQLIDAGCERILTSGQALTAPEGAGLIRNLQEIAGQRIVILPGSGVRPDNIAALALATGCKEFHASLRSVAGSTMTCFPAAFTNGDNHHYSVKAADVTALKAALTHAAQQ